MWLCFYGPKNALEVTAVIVGTKETKEALHPHLTYSNQRNIIFDNVVRSPTSIHLLDASFNFHDVWPDVWPEEF